jgi:LPXTG-site transpeptidase (sortase) family protein
MLKRLLHRFTNSLVILLGAYLILLGVANLVPEALAEISGSYPDDYAIVPLPVDTGSNASIPPEDQALLPIQPVAPLESPVLDPIVIPDTSLPATPPNYEIPSRLIIPGIHLDAPIVQALPSITTIQGQEFRIWDVPAGFLTGWHTDSAWLGQPGNLVLNGHHNVHGQVFARLIDLDLGDEILVAGQEYAYHYRVTEKLLLPEKNQPLEVRLENALYILPTSETRLTLITCWPYETNTHRLILIAEPVTVVQ